MWSGVNVSWPVSPMQPVIQSFLLSGRLSRRSQLRWYGVKADHTLRRMVPAVRRSRLRGSGAMAVPVDFVEPSSQAAHAGRFLSRFYGLRSSRLVCVQEIHPGRLASPFRVAVASASPRLGRGDGDVEGAAPFCGARAEVSFLVFSDASASCSSSSVPSSGERAVCHISTPSCLMTATMAIRPRLLDPRRMRSYFARHSGETRSAAQAAWHNTCRTRAGPCLVMCPLRSSRSPDSKAEGASPK